MNDALRAIGLTKYFDKKRDKRRISLWRRNTPGQQVIAVDKIDLSIPVNTLFGLLGPNGAGKTTTIKLLSTLLLPDEGVAYVNGFDVAKQANEVRSSIGVVTGGERGLYWRLTGRENTL